jgi:hypothetical protein
MSAQELRLSGPLSTMMRVNDLHDGRGGIVVHVESGLNSLSVPLDRNLQYMLFLYLQARLEK